MSEEFLLEEQRENWGTRSGFVLAAIGSAVGLGNLWGFPYKLYKCGGGAFLIPYVIAMLLIGIPLLIAEFSLGHLTQRAAPDAFGRANRKFAFVGWWQIILSFIIITYYAVNLAYCVSFLWYSIQGILGGALPWAGTGVEGVEKAKSFFKKDYLNSSGTFSLGRLQTHVIVAMAITWLLMYLCIFKGVKLVGKVVLWTVPLPWLMLLILTIRGLTLEGATEGLEYYLEPDWMKLSDPMVWRLAFGQMFFSMSLAFGVMVTYASFLHRKSDLNNNSAIIGLADLGTSFVAGLAIFATLGAMAFATRTTGAGVPVTEVADAGPGLAFVAFPYALAQLPHAAWFSLLFFGSLFLLGIDSAFSITECVLASIVDKTGWKRSKVLITLTIVGFAIGLLFCMSTGLQWLGHFDDLINGTWGIALTALLECFVLGWLFRLRRLRQHANERSDWKLGVWWDWAIRVVIPIVLAALFAWSLFDSMADPKGYLYKYKSDEVAVTTPATDDLPERAILELRFVAAYNAKPEHTFVLDDTKAKSAEAWAFESGESLIPKADKAPESAPAVEIPTTQPVTAPVKKTWKADNLAGKALTFTTASITPNTTYDVQYRWNSRPEKDPRTALPIKAETEPQWKELTRIETNSKRTSFHIGNLVGLSVMGLVPILAIVISSVRIRKDESVVLAATYSNASPAGRLIGWLTGIIALAGIVAMGLAMAHLMSAAHDMRLTGAVDNARAAMTTTRDYLVCGGGAALLSLLVGGLLVVHFERKEIRASIAVRLAAAMGVLGLGVCGGLFLALKIIPAKFAVAKMEYDNQLSATSYWILAAMLGIIVGGLGWCFYRAIKAAGESAGPQLPDDIEPESIQQPPEQTV